MPPDILLNVCLFLPIYVLKDFYDHLPIGKWKILVENRLYQNVFYGPALQGEYRYNISLEELVHFAKGELTTRIRSLHLFLQGDLFEAPCIDAFLAFAERYPNFLSLIPSIMETLTFSRDIQGLFQFIMCSGVWFLTTTRAAGPNSSKASQVICVSCLFHIFMVRFIFQVL